MSVIIDNNYLSSKDIRNNITTRMEVFAAYVINKYLLPDSILKVGAPSSKNLPDIFTKDKNNGFEVRLCEKNIDFNHTDATKELVEDNWDYEKYLQRLEDANSAIAKANLIITHNDKKVTSTISGGLGHAPDWMYDDYKKSLIDKLSKLNKDHYTYCKNNSLIILNLQRANGKYNAELFYKANNEIKDNYAKHFKNNYLITTVGIYVCNYTELKTIISFKDEDFNELVQEMKKALMIDEYEKE